MIKSVLPLLAAFSITASLSACSAPESKVLTPQEVAKLCHTKAKEAAGPTGKITLGSNTSNGPFGRLELGVSSDFLQGKDPQEVYKSCWVSRTGTLPSIPFASKTAS